MDKVDNLYSIGQAARKAKISTRTLRHYESIELIKPDYVKENGYRYYSSDTIMMVSIIKYLQFMEFSLEEIKEFIYNANYQEISESFTTLTQKTEEEISHLNDRLMIVKDWHNLIMEGSSALLIENNKPSIKYISEKELIKYEMTFTYNYEEAILDLDFSNFVKDQNNKITGPVMFYFNSYKQRIKQEKQNKPIDFLYIQSAVDPIIDKSMCFYLPQGFYVSLYHLGDYKGLMKSYEKLIDWANSNKFVLGNSVIERFVIDTWTFRNKNQYVTEILIPIDNKLK